MIGLLLELCIVMAVLGLIWWVTLQFPLPPPLPKVIQVVIVIIGVIYLIALLAGLAGGGYMMGGPVFWRR